MALFMNLSNNASCLDCMASLYAYFA